MVKPAKRRVLVSVRGSQYQWGLGLGLLLLTATAHAQVPRANPVPGGVAVIALGAVDTPRPRVHFGARAVLVTANDGHWMAVVGLPLTLVPGHYFIAVETDAPTAAQLDPQADPQPATQPDPPPATAPNAPNARQGGQQFRVYPVTAHPQPHQRVTTLPAELAIDFAPIDGRVYAEIAAYAEVFPSDLTADFALQPVLAAGNYIPYGRVIQSGESPQLFAHPWITYLTPEAAEVRAPGDAVVQQIVLTEGTTMAMVLQHGDGLVSIFEHIQQTHLSPGDRIQRGDILGRVTAIPGLTTARGRVDWKLLLNGYYIDPLQFIARG